LSIPKPSAEGERRKAEEEDGEDDVEEEEKAISMCGAC
jgi:hypothetical protein